MNLDYIFGRGVSSILPIDRLEFSFSKRTGRLKTISLDGRLVATIRPDGGVAPTLYGAGLLVKHPVFRENCVVVKEGADRFVAEGRSVFAKHVEKCGGRVRRASDVAVLDVKGEVIAVGRAILSAKMMEAFELGVAVKVRESVGASRSGGEVNA